MAAADAALYIRVYTDAGVMRMVGAPLSPQAAQRAFDLALAQAGAMPPRAHFWICCPHGRAGGGAGLLALLPDGIDHALAEVGILLLAEGQGRGYATQAISALADHAFTNPGLQRLWTRHARDNRAMSGLMQALGFQAETAMGDSETRWSLRREDWMAPPRARVFATRPADG